MKATRFSWVVLVVAVFGLLVAGCGGSGSSGASPTPETMQLFATDDLNTGYAHVWVTIDKIDLTGASGTTNIYDDTANGGKVVDLRTLRDSTGAKFLLLGGCNTPAGTYTGVNVTVASSLTVVPTGASTGTAATFANSTGGTFVLSLSFATPQTISSTNKMVVDFDLANWTLTGTTVSATNNQYLTQGTTTGLTDGTRQCSSDYVGTVSGLTGTAPTQTFTLTQGKNSINVTTSSSTTIDNSNGSSNPALANGAHVMVTGTYDPTNLVVDASEITIEVASAKPQPAHVIGLVTASDATAGTVTLQVQGCDGFQPSATTITVSVGASTMYLDGSGVTDTEAEFFSALVANTTVVMADGTLSGTTLTAADVAIAPTLGAGSGSGTPPPPRDVAVQGVTTNTNATAGTFDVTLANWEGGPLQKSGVIHVVTNSSTQFTNDGAAQTQAGFFAALTATTQVQIRGTFDLSTMTLTATQVNTGPGNQFHF